MNRKKDNVNIVINPIELCTITNMEMNDYSAPEYKDLYEEILIDYNWRYGKFSPIPYPKYTNCNPNEKQSIEISPE